MNPRVGLRTCPPFPTFQYSIHRVKTIDQLTRANVRRMKPYSSARDEYKGTTAEVFLDANESPYNNPLNRYPDPLQGEVKVAISQLKGVEPRRIFLGNGSDEAIDLCFRAFCEPRIDNVVAPDPTYGMYQVCAETNDVEYRKVLLDNRFCLTADAMLSASDAHTKLMFVCSPNNPTGNNMPRQEVERLLREFDGLVVVDEAYIDFSSEPSFTLSLDDHPNLIVLQTFSKAWGCAAIRLGMAFASEEIIGVFNKIKYPYNVNRLTQQQALRMLSRREEVEGWVSMIKDERTRLMQAFAELPQTVEVFPTDANFFLVRVSDALDIYTYLVGRGIIVRNRHTVSLCAQCLRITIGTPQENDRLLQAMHDYNAARS